MCRFCCARKSQRAEEGCLFLRGIGCAIGWIDTECDDVIIISGDHIRLLQTPRETVEHLSGHIMMVLVGHPPDAVNKEHACGGILTLSLGRASGAVLEVIARYSSCTRSNMRANRNFLQAACIRLSPYWKWASCDEKSSPIRVAGWYAVMRRPRQ